jgi:hypothetical protein
LFRRSQTQQAVHGSEQVALLNNVSRSGGDNTAAHGRDATEQPDREARAETNTAALESCIVLTPSLTNLPIDQIRQTVHPTADQEAALDNLSAASAQASEIIKSSCPASIPLTPNGRMDAAEQRLDATIKCSSRRSRSFTKR